MGFGGACFASCSRAAASSTCTKDSLSAPVGTAGVCGDGGERGAARRGRGVERLPLAPTRRPEGAVHGTRAQCEAAAAGAGGGAEQRGQGGSAYLLRERRRRDAPPKRPARDTCSSECVPVGSWREAAGERRGWAHIFCCASERPCPSGLRRPEPLLTAARGERRSCRIGAALALALFTAGSRGDASDAMAPLESASQKCERLVLPSVPTPRSSSRR